MASGLIFKERHATQQLSGSLLLGRFGTTLSKVSIHQLYQEEVPRHERGKISSNLFSFLNLIDK
jgi:hypothetical protein